MTQEQRHRFHTLSEFSFGQNPKTRKIGLITLAALLSLVAGGSAAIYYSSMAPLLLAGALALVGILAAWLKNPTWAVLAAIFIVLLPEGIIPPNIQSLLNRSTNILALLLMGFGVISRRHRFVWTSLAFMMLVFLVWSCVSLYWADNLGEALRLLQTYTLRMTLFVILVPNLVRDRASLNSLMNMLALLGLMLMISATVSFLSGGFSDGRLKILEMNENEQGVLALITMTGVLWQAMNARKMKAAWKILAWVYIALTIFVVATSGSRGSAISLFVTLFAFLIWKPTRLWGMIGFSMLIAGAILAPILFTTTVERFLVRESWDTLLGGRESLWQAAWILVKNHFWQGVGIGNAPYAMLPVLQLYRSTLGLEIAPVHNPLLTIWVETGLIGLVFYMGMLLTAIFVFVQQYFHFKRLNQNSFLPYFPLITSIFLGYFASWIKGGGMESGFSYFLMLALLMIPSHLRIEEDVTHDNPEH